jgi:uncharacterized protein (DUF2384 family)
MVERTVPAKRIAKKTSAVDPAPARVARAGAARVAADDPLSVQRVLALINAFTSSRLAELVGVSPSQPSRWASGKERPGPAAAPTLVDLDHIYARARLVWGPETARIWIDSANVYLGGARPIDVLRTDGPARVLEALDAEMWGGAA